MTSRSRFRIHNPFHRRKYSPNADAQVKQVEAAKDDSTTNSQLLATPGKSSFPADQSTQSSMPEDLWSAAYEQLGEDEQRVLSEIQLSKTSNDEENPHHTALLINEVIQLTEKQYEDFQQKVNRRLRESCQNIINAALSFKDIISAVAASDPTNHAASAWAVVSLRLTNHHDLRSTLFASSEYLADVLAQCAYIQDKIYLNGYVKIKRDLGNAIIRLYRAVLRYTTEIRIAQDPSVGRKLLDCVTTITGHPLTALKASVEAERNNDEAKEILRCIEQLAESMDHLIEKFKISNLHVEEAAFYDSYINQHEDFCLLDTRTELRSQILEWAESTDKGFSTITRQLVTTYQQLAPDFNKLLLQPLGRLRSNRPTTIMMDMQIIIRLLLSLQDCESVRLWIFLTSRPDLPIRLGFKERALPLDWPGQECIEKLVKMAIPLFIFAATICYSDLERTYIPVLNQLNVSKSKSDSEQLLKEFQDIVGVLILLATPLSEFAIAELTGIPPEIITNRLNRFHLVLSIPSESDKPVRILHLSFRDFLVNTTSIFHVDEAETHYKIALHYFQVMDERLKRNICGLSSYGTQKVDIDSQAIDQHIPASLCRVSEFAVLLPFLRKDFLHWLEALSLMGVLSEAVGMIDMLQAAVTKDTNTEISQFLHDARRFILRNMSMTTHAPLQLYYSGLMFSPEQSVMRKTYSRNIPEWICPMPQVEATWSPNLQTLTGHSGLVQSVAFSSDGSTLACGLSDNTIKLWDIKTASELQTLIGHSAFSSNGLTLASGSYDSTIKLWDVQTSSELQTFTGHSGPV
ncbi:hypothetical protein BJX68DRAFT_260056 [Aspergillus pseudodeflectus]|uniref:Mitochondrial division protein 1 n=1 Tax=Aspergillus pseudodeflectus TaxID=176178 RepID=A0ABR4JAF2_9EURO